MSGTGSKRADAPPGPIDRRRAAALRGKLRGFDRAAKRFRPVLTDRYDARFADTVLRDARREFEILAPDLPYIGGFRNVFSPVITANGWIAAVHRAMLANGRDVEDSVAVCVEVSDRFFRSFGPRLLAWLGRIGFAKPTRAFLRAQARRSKRREYAEDFVYTFHEGGEDDWELRFSECAVNKFYDANGLTELKPYCNFFDIAYSRLMGMGIDASETIGQGCTTCRLRYRHGRETAIPERLVSMFPE